MLMLVLISLLQDRVHGRPQACTRCRTLNNYPGLPKSKALAGPDFVFVRALFRDAVRTAGEFA
eukprot:CAMPEP_0177403200 /NCGR_PEP_ID=MMETSP0368-20130122/60691_1 /TAXON_ID=447022 ORGANISM="Scrippsiella hangoei-like, Strain SHHI-4" /NCGR_SAMPLE_ID=MMETSP0368 /ASSEMBLY_ACC=CAM_ASM_000363 /LENGTH=62 /DNA_ID=CAMNT_0018871101 /DNA_START=103 /DNA_END=291 /DNA_ORIENTATION=+